MKMNLTDEFSRVDFLGDQHAANVNECTNLLVFFDVFLPLQPPSICESPGESS